MSDPSPSSEPVPTLGPTAPTAAPTATPVAESEPPRSAPPPLPPRARWLGSALLVATLGVLALNLVWVVRNFSALRVVGPGQPAPGFDLRTIHNDRVRLSDLRGQVVLIDFWSVTCPPCLESLPHLNEVVDTFSRQPVTVLAIHAQGGPRWRALARREATRLGLRFPVLVDDPRGRTSSAYTVRVLPTAVLVGPRGRIRKVWRGATDVESLKAEIRDALEQRSAVNR